MRGLNPLEPQRPSVVRSGVRVAATVVVSCAGSMRGPNPSNPVLVGGLNPLEPQRPSVVRSGVRVAATMSARRVWREQMAVGDMSFYRAELGGFVTRCILNRLQF